MHNVFHAVTWPTRHLADAYAELTQKCPVCYNLPEQRKKGKTPCLKFFPILHCLRWKRLFPAIRVLILIVQRRPCPVGARATAARAALAGVNPVVRAIVGAVALALAVNLQTSHPSLFAGLLKVGYAFGQKQ